jgi:hypothetical protein
MERRLEEVKTAPSAKPTLTKMGCAILFVPTIIVIDTVGMAASWAGPYSGVVIAFAVVGCVLGSALGVYAATKTNPSSRWSPSFWIVLGGLVGITFPFVIVLYIVQTWLR